MANYDVEHEREKADTIKEMGGKKKYDAHQKKWSDKVKKRKEELAKKVKVHVERTHNERHSKEWHD
jgi:hypothetical protein